MRARDGIRGRSKFRACASLVVIGLLAALGVTTASQVAQAADLSKFDPGYIISDSAFYNGGAMSEGEVQNFLRSKVSSCASGKTCLKDFRQTTYNRAADAMCNGYAGAPDEPAARIIVKVAQSCGISPQVLLVMLQKEQGLVLSDAPTSWAWQASMGYACPDTAACDTKYFGFYNQVFMGSWQLKRYGNPPGTSNYFTWYPVGGVAQVRYHPDASCGSSAVRIANKATAALYYYTPYQPNAASLAAGYGASSNPCSSYGNRNFYNWYSDWFGAPQGESPIGNYESTSVSPGSVRVVGWTLDPDTKDPINIHVYVNDVGTAHLANQNRPDVGAVYPASGATHGFDVTVPAQSTGPQRVCVYAISLGGGANTDLGCRTVEAIAGPPEGGFAVTATDGKVAVSGWAVDPDTHAPINVHIYVDNAGAAYLANKSTTSLPAKYAGYGKDHGFAETIQTDSGRRNVCVYAINLGVGGNQLLGCQVVQVPGAAITEQNRAPIGYLDAVTTVPGSVTVKGWSLDPDTRLPINVHLYVGSASTAHVANRDRPDVAVLYPAHGATHGFEETLKVPAGTHEVCAYGINAGPGNHTMLGCKTVTVFEPIVEKNRAPIGYLDSVSTAPGSVTIAGWALDPDTAAPINVHLYVGKASTAHLSNRDRPDVAALYPSYGAAHGYNETLKVPAGTHEVCAYGINAGPGNHTMLGCKTVTVYEPIVEKNRAPIGYLDSVSTAPGSVTIAGWALDPDTAAPINVHLYVGKASTAHLSNRERTDVAALYPSYGASHGYRETLKAPAGTHEVCAYGINAGAGGHTLLGCTTVTVP